MTEIFVTAAAPTREAALAMMEALGVADVSSGNPVPIVQVTIAEAPAPEGVTKSLWNFWYYGDSAEALRKPEPEGGWPDGAGLFERTNLLEMIDARTGIAPQWVALSNDVTPPGYEMPDGCRLYDPALIATKQLVLLR